MTATTSLTISEAINTDPTALFGFNEGLSPVTRDSTTRMTVELATAHRAPLRYTKKARGFSELHLTSLGVL